MNSIEHPMNDLMCSSNRPPWLPARRKPPQNNWVNWWRNRPNWHSLWKKRRPMPLWMPKYASMSIHSIHLDCVLGSQRRSTQELHWFRSQQGSRLQRQETRIVGDIGGIGGAATDLWGEFTHNPHVFYLHPVSSLSRFSMDKCATCKWSPKAKKNYWIWDYLMAFRYLPFPPCIVCLVHILVVALGPKDAALLRRRDSS